MGDVNPTVGATPNAGTNTEKHNVFAILSLIFAFLLPPLGVVFGFVALSQIKKTGEQGKGLAIAGIIVGLVIIVGFIAQGIVWIVVRNIVRDGAAGIENAALEFETGFPN